MSCGQPGRLSWIVTGENDESYAYYHGPRRPHQPRSRLGVPPNVVRWPRSNKALCLLCLYDHTWYESSDVVPTTSPDFNLPGMLMSFSFVSPNSLDSKYS